MLAVLYSFKETLLFIALSYERGDMSYFTDIHPKHIYISVVFYWRALTQNDQKTIGNFKTCRQCM